MGQAPEIFFCRSAIKKKNAGRPLSPRVQECTPTAIDFLTPVIDISLVVQCNRFENSVLLSFTDQCKKL
jgi:hypothetical protein